MPSPGSISEYYVYQQTAVYRHLELCLGKAEKEVVHRLRLSIKKLNAFNKLAEHLCLADFDAHFQNSKKIRRLYALAGQLRDTQVQLHLLATAEGKAGSDYLEFSKWLINREKKRISRFVQKSQNTRLDPVPHIATTQISIKLAMLSQQTLVDDTATFLSGLLVKAGKLSAGNIAERDLHRIRIITKQIRYVSQIVKHCYSDFDFHEISFESLRKIETVAGKWHDYLVRIELLERFIKKYEHSDQSDSIKYQAFLTDCKKELELAYKNACRVVKHEMKTKIIDPEN